MPPTHAGKVMGGQFGTWVTLAMEEEGRLGARTRPESISSEPVHTVPETTGPVGGAAGTGRSGKVVHTSFVGLSAAAYPPSTSPAGVIYGLTATKLRPVQANDVASERTAFPSIDDHLSVLTWKDHAIPLSPATQLISGMHEDPSKRAMVAPIGTTVALYTEAPGGGGGPRCH
jgi:hypothetical protein